MQLVVTDGNGDSLPADISISVTEPEHADALCEFSVQNEWYSGFAARVRITNGAPCIIDDWIITLTSPDNASISGLWNSQLSGSNPYTISNANHNSRIKPSESVQFGFNAQKAQPGNDVSVHELSGICRRDNSVNTAPIAVALAPKQSGEAPLTVSFVGS